MSIFPKRWMGRGIPTDNIPKHYFKDGNIYETKTNKQVKSKKMKYKNKWIEVLSDHEITEYSKNLEPIWIILEEDEHKIPILAQPDGYDNYHGEDDCVYHYCDISHFMKIERPKFNDC